MGEQTPGSIDPSQASVYGGNHQRVPNGHDCVPNLFVLYGGISFEDQEGHRVHSPSIRSQDSEENEMLSSYFRRP